MSMLYFTINEVCQSIEKVVNEKYDIVIKLFSQHDIADMSFKLLVCYEFNGQTGKETVQLNYEDFHCLLEVERIKFIYEKVYKVINKIIETPMEQTKQTKKVEYKPLRCQCCGGTIKNNICEYCRTEYAIF